MNGNTNASNAKKTKPRAKKKFGQHFLVHQPQIERILNLVEAEPSDLILEIGPGPGTLTLPLHRRGHSLILVEADEEWVQHLREIELDPAPTLIHADFMRLDLDLLITKDTKVVSNLPYNVSVPITARLLRKTHAIAKMVMMYQKEVAVRIAAKPGTRDYGQISVVCQALYRVRKGFDLSPGAFKPPPKVWSRVLVFDRRQDRRLALKNLDILEQLLGALFSHRRKMITSILKKWPPGWSDSTALLESYLACGFDPSWRPEALSADDFVHWLNTHLEMNEGH